MTPEEEELRDNIERQLEEELRRRGLDPSLHEWHLASYTPFGLVEGEAPTCEITILRPTETKP